MPILVMVRHGQSQANLENRFTGWSDVPLTAKGVAQGRAVGRELAARGFKFSAVHTSYMQRAILTADSILEAGHQLYLPVYKTWRLNERHYGALSGQNKDAVRKRVGAEQLHRWRRGFFELPPQLKTREHARRYDRLGVRVPLSESLAMTLDRVWPYWEDQVAPRLLDGKDQLLVAHGSTLRALVKRLEGIGDDQIDQVEVPNGQPIVYHFDAALTLIDKEILRGDGNV